MTTGPGLIMPTATAIRNSRSPSQPYSVTRPCSRKGTITRPLPKVNAPAFRKNASSLRENEPRSSSRVNAAKKRHSRNWRNGKERPRAVPVLEKASVKQNADHAGDDEDERDLGLEGDRYSETGRSYQPLQPILHAELRKPVARMQDERDDGGADAIEDAVHALQVAEMHKERAKRRHDQEIRQDEGPSACPGAPEAAAQIGDEDADLNGERPWQGLADGDRLAHLLARQPFPLADQFPFHLADKGDRAAEAHKAEAQEVEGRGLGPRRYRVRAQTVLRSCDLASLSFRTARVSRHAACASSACLNACASAEAGPLAQ